MLYTSVMTLQCCVRTNMAPPRFLEAGWAENKTKLGISNLKEMFYSLSSSALKIDKIANKKNKKNKLLCHLTLDLAVACHKFSF